jgi:DinB superfamily
MKQELDHTVSLLARTPVALDALLRHLPYTWTLRNEGGDSWSASEVVAHLIHAERTDWIPRARMILQFGESQTFEPFNRRGHVQESQGQSLPELLDAFARSRAQSLDQLRTLNPGPDDLERRGQHPTLGSVTLSALLATWAVHDLTHLHQISRIMAHQYRDAVGPWSRYLGVLQCAGHSASS